MTEEEKKLKTLNVEEDTWERLYQIKIKKRFKKMDEVVTFLLNDYDTKI